MFDHIMLPPAFKGCTFVDTKWGDGTLLTADREPVVLKPVENGNIVFPSDWTEGQRRAYRMAHNLPGTEWWP